MKKILREYLVEIIALLIALLGVFLLVEQFEIRKTLLAMINRLVDFLPRFISAVKTELLVYVDSVTLSDLVGWILITLTGIVIVWRVRYRFAKSGAWRANQCPRCGGKLHRIHRNPIDRLFSWTLLPRARRYRCADPECNWAGLRRSRTGGG